MSGTTYENYIHQFVSNNYNELIDVAEKDCDGTIYNPLDLLSELVDFLYSNPVKINAIKDIGKDRPMMRYCSQWLYNNIRLYTANAGLSNFKSRFKLKEAGSEITEGHTERIPDRPYKPLDENTAIYDHVVMNELNQVEQRLYHLYFIEKLSTRKIKHLLKDEITEYGIGKMIRDLKEKITLRCKELKNERNQIS